MITSGEVMVVQVMVTKFKVNVLLCSVDCEGVYCVATRHIAIFIHKCKVQDVIDYTLENKYIPKFCWGTFSITVGSDTT